MFQGITTSADAIGAEPRLERPQQLLLDPWLPLPRLFGRALKGGGRVTQGSKLLRGKPASAA